jgi:hypothetical protein
LEIQIILRIFAEHKEAIHNKDYSVVKNHWERIINSLLFIIYLAACGQWEVEAGARVRNTGNLSANVHPVGVAITLS